METVHSDRFPGAGPDQAMRLVEEQEVIETWLRMELDKESKAAVALGEDEVHEEYRTLTQLLVQKPNCGQVFVEYDLQWCVVRLTESQFQGLQTIWGDERTVMERAQALHSGSSDLEEDRKARIREFADRPVDATGQLILNRRPPLFSGPFVQDGNHRAVAIALRVVRGEQYPETAAYIGYPSLDCVGCTALARAWWHVYRDTI